MAGTIDVGTIKVGGLAELKAQLREIKGELANATDPEQMQRLAEAAGQVSDQIKDANEQVAVFATGSKFEATNNAFGLMKSQLMSLDFEGAATSAKMFQKTLGSISPAEIGTQMKGLISVVGSLSKAFFQFGLSLLANPIFLIAAVIIAIVVAIGVFLNKLGILKPIMEKIGKVFEAIGLLIDICVQALKDFSDWLGLTANAAEDSAKRQIAASEAASKAAKEQTDSTTGNIQHQIDMMKALGKDTSAVEIYKQKVILQSAKVEEQRMKDRIKNHQIAGDLTKEETQKLKESLAEQKKVVKQSTDELEMIRLNAYVKKKEAAKKEAEEQSKANKEAAQKAKEYQQNRLEAARMIQDLELSLMKEGIEKELKTNEIKYQRLIEDTKRNEKLTSDEKKKAIIEYELIVQKESESIKKKFDDKTKADEKEKQAKLLEILKEANDKRIALEDAHYELMNTIEVENIAKSQGQNAANKKKEENELIKKYDDRAGIIQAYYQNEIALNGENSLAGFAAKIAETEELKKLEEQQKTELDAINEKYRKLSAEKDEEERLKKIANVDKTTSMMADATKTGLQGISDIVGAFAGKSVSAQKKAFETQKKINIVMATIDMIKGAVSAFSNAQQLGPIAGPIVGALVAASVVASGIANIKKISATKFEGGGGGSAPTAPSTGGGGSASTGGQATPSFNLFGQSNNMNSLTAQKPVEASQTTLKAVVVESDITTTQSKVKKMQESATL